MRLTRTLAVYSMLLMAMVSVFSGCTYEQKGLSTADLEEGSHLCTTPAVSSADEATPWGAVEKLDNWIRRNLW